MANYDSNYEIAQEISARIGTSPIPFDSVYSICLAIYQDLGGTEDNFDSVYSILLEILPLIDGGVASKVIDDSIITTAKTWSSSKINSELSEKATTAYVDASLALKQNTLTAGDNISIENDTILALTASNSEIDLLFKTPIPLNEIWYTSLDGNVINVERTAFTSNIVSNTYNNGKGIVKFADNVYTVGALAYKNKTNLTSIELPEVTGRIGGDCFTGCINLTSIVIPATVKSIIKNAFSGCTHLTSISFTGTISQWNSISKGSGWKTKVPATVVHCSDGDVNI